VTQLKDCVFKWGDGRTIETIGGTVDHSTPIPIIALPKPRKVQKEPKNISTPTKNSTTKMALTSWTEYHESLLKNEPWVEKLKKQSKATLEFVNNS
jgi:hypothetical protein